MPVAEWVGRKSESTDVVSDRLLQSFHAIFGPYLAETGAGVAPPGLHWCLAPAIEPMAGLGEDGHPTRSAERPPLPPARRMWGGGWVDTLDPLRAGDRVRRISTVADVVEKHGQSGAFWVVAIDRDYVTGRGLAIRERHDVVYRKVGTTAGERQTSVPRPPSAPAARTLHMDTSPTLLFRYSAISFNGHRIHYDLPYARDIEGYRGLVVHAPLQATLLLNLAMAGGVMPRRFSYRAVAPAIAGDALTACAHGNGEDFWIAGPTGIVSMTARAVADPGLRVTHIAASVP